MNATIGQAIALIPARSGSKRVLNKNVLKLNGHPLVAYSIAAALESGLFSTVFVSTESEEYAEIAKHYGAEVSFLRPKEFALDLSPDIDWVKFTLSKLASDKRLFDHFSILRPTSPLRTAQTIKRAYSEFLGSVNADSLRAVELCKQHPAKMWKIVDGQLVPMMVRSDSGIDWFSSPTQSLPEIWVQNASIEIAHVRCIDKFQSITGKVIIPFKTEYPEGFDVNRQEDIEILQSLVAKSPNILPKVIQKPI